MVEYIYFVKCPNCEDEHFYFFNDAKECAMGRLSQKPIITQTEVNRNDFGECTDHCDLGTVWSWEDMMKDVPVDSEQTTFAKADTLECDNCFDQEFDNLDNSLEPITEETEACTLGFYDRETEDQVLVSFYSFADADEYVASHEGIRDLYTDPKYTSENYLNHINQHRKPVPAEMTVEQLVEELEENEDTVECKSCLELFDKSECRHDADYGWLCSRCQRAIEDHGGSLTLTETSKYRNSVELHYDNLTTEITTKVIPATRLDPEEYEEEEYTGEYDFEVETDRVTDTIWENFITEEDAADVPGGLEALEDEAAWEAFLETNLDTLLDKYNDQLLAFFREEAEKAAVDEFQDRYADLHSEGPDPDRAYDEWRDSQHFEEEYPRRAISEDIDPREMVELEYPSLTVTLYGPKRDVDDWDEVEHTTSHVFLVPKVEVATAIWENWITDEDVADVKGGLETLEDDAAWEKFLETHFDDLFEKYHQQILKHFEDEAAEDFRERSQEEHDLERWANNSKIYDWDDSDVVEESVSQKTFLEEFDDAETHKASLTDCPECGTASYDMKEQYCTNCGLNL